MDRPLDDMIVERQRGGTRGRRDGRYTSGSRDGARKTNQRDEPRDLNREWVHDRYEGDRYSRGSRDQNDRRIDRYQPTQESRAPTAAAATKIRVDNLHYELSETDLRELFTRIGPISTCQIIYDRSDRSTGVAYVTYMSLRDANDAVREFDGANAFGQPIQLTLLPGGPSSSRNPLDSATRPINSRSLFERIDTKPERGGRERNRRSESPNSDVAARRSDVRMPPPDHIDRYVPGDRSRSRSPPRRGRGSGGRRGGPAPRRDDRGGGGGKERDSRRMVQGRPRKTVDELDAEMEDYWGPAGQENGRPTTAAAATTTSVPAGENDDDEDIDMIE